MYNKQKLKAMHEITKIVADILGVEYSTIFSSSRKLKIVEARQASMYVIKEILGLSFKEIGCFFNRDHSTALYSYKTVRDNIDTYTSKRKQIEEIFDKCKQISKSNRITYIAHPISGDIEGNVKKILDIVREINLNEPEVIPFVPYLADVLSLDDSMPDQRKRGINNNSVYLNSGIISELRVYGEKISKGVAEEIALARQFKIPVVYKIDN